MDSRRIKPRPAKRPSLERTADGKLRPTDQDADIGDVWAHQRRLGLAESLAEDRRRAARERLKHERGLVGLALLESRIAVRRLRMVLFGTRSLRKPTSKPSDRSKGPTKPKQPGNLELTFAMPSVSWLYPAKLRRLPRMAVLAFVVLFVAGLAVLITTHAGQSDDTGKQAAATSGRTAGQGGEQSAKLQRGTPAYKTVLPAGKDIGQLGGWTRVSPPNKNPVYAFVDSIGTTQISVSEQPLPGNFKNDTAAQVDELAKGFNANEKLTAGDTTIHLGTSAKGAQSVIFSKNGLLILIKSTSQIPSAEWVKYVDSLQ